MCSSLTGWLNKENVGIWRNLCVEVHRVFVVVSIPDFLTTLVFECFMKKNVPFENGKCFNFEDVHFVIFAHLG